MRNFFWARIRLVKREMKILEVPEDQKPWFASARAEKVRPAESGKKERRSWRIQKIEIRFPRR